MPNKICIVDDDSFYAEILANLLSMQGYEYQYYASATECLSALAQDTNPEPYLAFILDVVMPDMDGYELCENLRGRQRFESTPVLFVSSKNTLEDRMRGYEAGGNDYLGKPVQPEELKIKLDLAIKRTNEQKAQKPQIQPASIMAPSENIAQLISFLQSCQAATRFQEIADLLLEQLSALGLAGSLMIRNGEMSRFQSVDGSEHAIEKELLTLALENQKQIEFNGRLIVNTPNVSLLIRRLPDTSDNAQIKEQLVALAEVADLRVSTLIRNQVEQHQKKYWLELLVAAEKGMSQSTSDNFYRDHTIHDIMEEFLISLNENLLDVALDKDQEQLLKQIFRKQVDKVTDLLRQYTQSIEEAQKPFQDLIEKLNSTL